LNFQPEIDHEYSAAAATKRMLVGVKSEVAAQE
jgi:hypothetical protein